MEKQGNRVEYIKIADIQFSERNIKEKDSLLFEKMKKSIQLRGQLKNIVVCETETGYECLEGSKICKALKELGFEFINDIPKKGADNKLVCFIHPKNCNGVLIELCQSNH